MKNLVRCNFKKSKLLTNCNTSSECGFAAAVRRNKLTAKANRAEVENVIKLWLRYAADRDGGRHGRVRRQTTQQPASDVSD